MMSVLLLMLLPIGILGGTIHVALDKFISSAGLKEAGYKEFQVSSLYEVHDNGKMRFNAKNYRTSRRSLESSTKDIDLELQVFGDTLHLSVRPVKSVLHPDATVITTNGDTQQVWTGNHPDCFISGRVTSHGGSVAMSHCDELIGILTTPTHEYQISTLPHHVRRDITDSDDHPLLISRRPLVEDTLSSGVGPLEDFIARGQLLTTRLQHQGYTTPRLKSTFRKFFGRQHDIVGLYEKSASDEIQIPDTGTTSVPNNNLPGSFVIETAVFTDELFTQLFNTTDPAKRLELLMLKYSGVQEEWSRADMLGYNITIQIKLLNIFDVNPSWYNIPNNTHGLLHIFCSGTQHLSHDHVFLHTGFHTTLGLSYVSGVCKSRQRCGFESSRSLLKYVATAHETGHTMGMGHDVPKGCKPPDVGCMGGYGAGWSTCSRRDMNSLLHSGKADCVFREDVATSEVASQLQHLALPHQLIGFTYTPDEICEELHGTGFRYRVFPDTDICKRFSCVNMNQGKLFGQMFLNNFDIPGQYCGDGKVCHKKKCITLAADEQPNAPVRAGGWSSWSNWHPCTRSCGTGVMFRRRTCTNPTPKNHAPCEGEDYEASVCNVIPCRGDSSDSNTLIKQRGSEKCAELIKNGVLNDTQHLPSGDRYSSSDGVGQCEILCDTVDGYKNPAHFRFGLMPDGTPCDASLEPFDKNDWPIRKGYHGHCLEGYCKSFGCDGNMNGKEFDKCGVCGGNNSTCRHFEGVFNETLTQGERRTIATIPTGAFNIQFWFKYTSMKQMFLELWNKDNATIIASAIYDSWIYDDTNDPVNFAGVLWYYYFHDQFLYTKGPITEPAIIKAFRYGANPDKGIYYSYSEPLSGSCANNGVWNTTLCSCDCPPAKYGPTCSFKCNTFCMNDAPLDESTCSCRCNDRQTGHNCRCNSGYTGRDCRDCSHVLHCSHNGNFNTTTCKCDCPDGRKGARCNGVVSASGLFG